MQYIIKILWYAFRNSRSYFKWLFFKLLKGTYFNSIGNKTKFYGTIRFGSVEDNISVGSKCMIGHDVFLSAVKGSFINIGDNCSINTGGHIVATEGITIKDETHIGEYCTIRDQNHAFDDLSVPIHEQGFKSNPVVIGKNCWLGRGVIITAGVVLGDGCVVGANSVVTKSFEPNSVIVGVPARLIRKRGDSLIFK